MTTKFGHEMREQEFSFAKDFININHGSFGAIPEVVRSANTEFQALSEARPDAFLRYSHIKLLNESRRLLSESLNAPLPTIVLLLNATTGVNTVLRNLKYKPDDVIIYFSTTYGACQKIVYATTEFTGCKAHCIPLTFPLSHAEIVDKFTSAVAQLKSQGLHPKALILDTIVSLPGVRMPFEALITECKAHDVLSVVDGAHGCGHIALDLTALDPDFFVSNLHKWGSTPRPSAVFYVPVRNQHLIRTTFPTSHYFVPLGGEGASNPLGPLTGDDSNFTKQFEFVGTPANSPYYCVGAAMRFREEVCGGEEKIMAYCAKLAMDGGKLVAGMLETEVLDNDDGTLTKGCAMVNVRVPLHVGSTADGAVALGPDGVGGLINWLQLESIHYNTFMPFFTIGEALWTRLSGQIYLELSDFKFAGTVLQDLCKRVTAGEHLKPAAEVKELAVR